MIRKSADFFLYNLESWCLGYLLLCEASPKPLYHSLPAYSGELYTCCYETWVLPVMPIPLWSWPGVTRTMWGDADQPTVDLSSSFRTRFFALQPGLAWPWSSFPSKVTFGRGGAEARWSPGFCAPGFLVIFFLSVQGVLPWSLLRIQCPLVYLLVRILADLEAFFEFLTMTLADRNAVLLKFFKLLCLKTCVQ